MGIPKALVVAVLALAAAMSVVPLQAAGAQSPSTKVLIPSSGATLSGTTYLDASASNATSVEFLLFGGTYGYAAPVVCTATQTYYGWLCSWNTTTVANGSYALVSEASGAGGSAFSASGVSITLNNSPPSTSVIIPANGATLDNAKGWILDALASPGVTTVSIVGTPTVTGLLPMTFTLTPTIYGWIYQDAAFPPCAGCVPIDVPVSFQSVASYANGISGTSKPVSVTNIIYVESSGI
jgi:Bacterial Ig domain